ncbi:putative aquaporin NIP4-1 [Capsicum annuum]|uniref:Aquaporin NIP4-1 n=1 Tax=Capsicum annuum TaxID=4072 RepID=A0A1U8FNP1_CAPAN|nr:probable aquaporin NIP-type [Capsicum annuum]KAF3629635.1 putative aquaporin NIP4-1 [Capsicum annuum]KAF3635533.1 putative aquaporin NIP4-1 [Capsicum annuum]PHT91308.1 putative aquaporin NIP4-1 [Capsicum annuum]
MASKREEISQMEEGKIHGASVTNVGFCASTSVVVLIQKLIAEVIGTYFVIFAGCGSVVVNKLYGSVTFPGICVTWGLIVMVMAYTVGHISGAHFNPAVTITFTLFRRLPWKEAPLYIIAQLMGSLLASVTLVLMFDVTPEAYFGTVPVGSNGQSLAVEIIISFLLMFVICGIATDDRAIGHVSGIAVGMTITLNVFVGGPISGASMNPARSIAPALVKHVYKGLWVYIVGPIVGTLAGAFVYHLLRATDKPLNELAKSVSSIRR